MGWAESPPIPLVPRCNGKFLGSLRGGAGGRGARLRWIGGGALIPCACADAGGTEVPALRGWQALCAEGAGRTP